MKFQKDVLSAVLRDMEKGRNERERIRDERRHEVYARAPRVRQIDAALQSTAAQVIRASLEAGGDPTEAVAALRESSLTLQEERRQILRGLGLPGDYLQVQYDCPACSDMGYIGNRPCECLKALYAKKLTERLSAILPIQDQNFASFRFDYYSDRTDARTGMSPRDCIQYAYNTCREYARNFSLEAGNLLLFGSAGLGKTFLSTSIAKEVSERGFSVAYDMAINIIASYETVKFGGPDPEAAQSAIRRWEAADLLIMDDLGTELSTGFTVSAFYQLLNTRLMSRRPMIINTNLLPEEFEKKYSAAIASRLRGEFTLLRFTGDDIRRLRKQHGK